ncbi:hypothetical protein GF402_08300 [Candidatus Fermentibacteria bacterium]|nr:hypothetical protein [Candidatus Fermentibacteria bacterium]
MVFGLIWALLLPMLIAASPRIAVVNDMRGTSIEEVYLSSVGEEGWGENLVEGLVVTSGSWFETEVEPGLYRLRAIDGKDRKHEVSLALVLSDYTWRISVEEPRSYSMPTG